MLPAAVSPNGRRPHLYTMDWLGLLVGVVVWLVLTQWVLPKLGVPT